MEEVQHSAETHVRDLMHENRKLKKHVRRPPLSAGRAAAAPHDLRTPAPLPPRARVPLPLPPDARFCCLQLSKKEKSLKELRRELHSAGSSDGASSGAAGRTLLGLRHDQLLCAAPPTLAAPCR
eukprot:COSAG01_NODE_382_length_17840_cov_68.658663_7_plen_124_part_00